MATNVVEVTLSAQQYEQLVTLARANHLPLEVITSELVGEGIARRSVAITSGTTDLSAQQLQRARSLMRALGCGLGAGETRSTARNHDAYLYRKEQ